MRLQCHCGNVVIYIKEEPATLTRCNCSVCRRYGALWGYYDPGEVEVTIGPKGTGEYCWGDQNIEFLFCSGCGCMTHYETTRKSEVEKVGVNFRMAEPKDIEGIRIRNFDGADSWQFLD